MATGRYSPDQLLDYAAVDLTDAGVDESMRQRDEFNFSVGIQFGEPTIAEIRRHLVDLSRRQHERSRAAV